MTSVISVIREEHRSIAMILYGMQYLCNEIREHGRKIDMRVFWSMLYYLDTFSERMHHPKQDKFLCSVLKKRTREAADIIGDLGREHASGESALKSLEQALARFQEGGMKEFPAFAEGVERFARGYWEHMRKEEESVLPLAQKVLDEADQAGIRREFESNLDPLASERENQDYQRLFSKIVSLAPSPIGVGPELS